MAAFRLKKGTVVPFTLSERTIEVPPQLDQLLPFEYNGVIDGLWLAQPNPVSQPECTFLIAQLTPKRRGFDEEAVDVYDQRTPEDHVDIPDEKPVRTHRHFTNGQVGVAHRVLNTATGKNIQLNFGRGGAWTTSPLPNTVVHDVRVLGPGYGVGPACREVREVDNDASPPVVTYSYPDDGNKQFAVCYEFDVMPDADRVCIGIFTEPNLPWIPTDRAVIRKMGYLYEIEQNEYAQYTAASPVGENAQLDMPWILYDDIGYVKNRQRRVGDDGVRGERLPMARPYRFPCMRDGDYGVPLVTGARMMQLDPVLHVVQTPGYYGKLGAVEDVTGSLKVVDARIVSATSPQAERIVATGNEKTEEAELGTAAERGGGTVMEIDAIVLGDAAGAMAAFDGAWTLGAEADFCGGWATPDEADCPTEWTMTNTKLTDEGLQVTLRLEIQPRPGAAE